MKWDSVTAGYLRFDDDLEEWVIELGNWQPPEEVKEKYEEGGVWVEAAVRVYSFQP